DVVIGVERRLKGDSPATVVVEQVATAGPTVSSEVGPAYKPGEREVLFLRPGEGPRLVVLPQGRYRLERGTVHPVGPGSAADQARCVAEARFLEGIEAMGKQRK